LIEETVEHKRTSYELLGEEFAPQYELLKKSKEALGEQRYREMVEQLADEESDRKMDIDLAMNDREQEIEERMKRLQIEKEAICEQKLKEAQTEEKIQAFRGLEQEGAVKEYLEMEEKTAAKDLEKFKKAQEKEKQRKLDKI